MNNNLTIVIGHGQFHFPNLALASAARDWAVLHAVDFDKFRARYPDIPYDPWHVDPGMEHGSNPQ